MGENKISCFFQKGFPLFPIGIDWECRPAVFQAIQPIRKVFLSALCALSEAGGE
jgi:hypothetical protein